MEEKIYVVGHKNPDTDSICSAIAYANLKNIITDSENYIPKRAGRVSLETRFVLDYFGMEAPDYIDTLEPRMRDVSMRKTKGIDEETSLQKAYNQMRDENLRTLPVFKNDKMTGLITQGDIAHSMMSDYGSDALSISRVSCKNILETLDGKLLVGNPDAVFDSGKICVGAANPEKMTQFIEPDAMVIMGNRSDAQISALEKGAKWLIVGLDSEVFESIKELAEKKDCNIIITPYDTFTITRLINQSMPVRHIMHDSADMVCFRDTDFVKDARKIITKRRLRYFPVLDKDDNVFGLVSQRNILDMEIQKVILVDHNEKVQSPEGIESVEVAEIIDHHRIGGVTTHSPVFFRNMPLGCTCTIVAMIYRENSIVPSKEMAGLMCSAILSDTLCFKSPTCTPTDESIARELAGIAGIDPEQYALEMFSAGCEISDKNDKDILYQDFKKFIVDGKSFGIGQVSIIGDESLNNLKGRMLDYLPKALAENDYDVICLMLTDIIKENTLLLFTGKIKHSELEELISTAFSVDVKGDSVLLPGVVSRKKQLLPKLIEAAENL